MSQTTLENEILAKGNLHHQSKKRVYVSVDHEDKNIHIFMKNANENETDTIDNRKKAN